MNLLSAKDLSKSFGDRTLFSGVTLGLNEGDRAAIIGINGSGKSTLLNIIAGKDTADTGDVALNNKCVINHLEQSPFFETGQTVLDYIFTGDTPLIKLIRDYERLCIEAEKDPSKGELLQKVMDQMEARNAWSYEFEVKSIMGELGINDTTLLMETLSGGMLKKVALAKALISEGNLLILDEPTNHLDIDTVEWLQGWLENTKKAVLLVTHDRYFLDNVCNLIFELNPEGMMRFEGNYSDYLEKKAELELQEEREQNKLQNVIRNELKWLMRSPKARTTKQKARKERFTELTGNVKKDENRDIEFETAGRRLGKRIVELENVSKAYGDNVLFNDFSHAFKRGEKVGIAGPNGVGKTTFLRIVTGEEEPDSGSVKIGQNTVFGVFDQHSKELDDNEKVLDHVNEISPNIKLKNGNIITAPRMLERFLFPSHTHYSEIGKLSGGEKRRLHLVCTLMVNPNFLILDEPTNDLDIKTLSVLEEFLDEFPGCVLTVSHDRYFMDRVCDEIYIFKGDAVLEHFPGSYSQYLEKKISEKPEAKKETIPREKPKREKKGLSFKEKREMEDIEKRLEELENEKNEMDKILSDGGSDYSKLAEAQKRGDEIEMEMLELMERQEELEAMK